MTGNEAVVEGAILAGCRFYAGYPITPASEVLELMASRLPGVGGVFVQCEDEISSVCMVIGASWAGFKAMTATSGPGFSLMQEAIGLATITETPIVITNIMRAGPSTGVPTKPFQGDVMQARWGSHGHYEIIVLAPSYVQEMYDLTIKAFNLSEKFRVPVIILSDALLSHLRENIWVRDRSEVEIHNRKTPSCSPSEFKPYRPGPDLVPEMAVFGSGYRVHVESLAHNEEGFFEENAYQQLVKRLSDKILNARGEIVETETIIPDGCEKLLVSYGSIARIVKSFVKSRIRAGDCKIGFLRPKVLWPVDEEAIADASRNVDEILVVEMNYGQYFREVARIAGVKKTRLLPWLKLEPPSVKDLSRVISHALGG